MMQPCTEEELMLYHNFTMMNEDETADPVGTAILPSTTTMPSKRMTRTTGPRSFGRRMARVGTGVLLLLLMVEGVVVLPEKKDDEGAWWSDPTAAAETARTPRRHRRNLVAKKNSQEAPPTEDEAVGNVAWKPICVNSVVCPTRCMKLYVYCHAEVNACLNEPTSTCSDMYNKMFTTCSCDTDFTCACGILSGYDLSLIHI